MHELGTPWHLRQAAHEHHSRFQKLAGIHRLTLAWLAAQGIPLDALRPPPAVLPHLWMLPHLAEGSLEKLLDDTAPEDLLRRLEGVVWTVHACAIRDAVGETGRLLLARCQAAARDAGAKAAAPIAAWLAAPPQAALRRSLKPIVPAAAGTPFGDALLVTRVTDLEARIEWQFCPHRSAIPEVRSRADELCSAHAGWLEGFVTALAPTARVLTTHAEDGGRCRQAWNLPLA